MPKAQIKETTLETILSSLRDSITNGALAPGSKINEVELAEKLGISRTPLREALRTLESEELITSERNRGFWVVALDAKELREVYPIILALESLAIRDGGVFIKTSIPRLKELNALLKKKSRQPRQAAAIDLKFHDELIQHSSNRKLLDMIQSLKLRMSRYENIYMSDSSLIDISQAQYALIIEGIVANDMGLVLKNLQENWQFGMEALIRLL